MTSGHNQSPARRTFWGAFHTSAVTALLKNLGGGVEEASGLTRPFSSSPPVFMQPLVDVSGHQRRDAHTSCLTRAAMHAAKVIYRGFRVRVTTRPATFSYPFIKLVGTRAVCQPSGPFAGPGKTHEMNLQANVSFGCVASRSSLAFPPPTPFFSCRLEKETPGTGFVAAV